MSRLPVVSGKTLCILRNSGLTVEEFQKLLDEM